MEHITINSDRSVTVPVEIRKIGVQYDHNVNTIEFVGPRYSSNVDLSTMTIYINYILSDKTPGKYKAENVIIDDQDDSLIRFNWTITRNVTKVSGILSCLVCAKKTDGEGNEINHWNTDIFRLLSVSEGMENDSVIQEQYPDVITSLIQNVEEHDAKLLEFSGLNNRVTNLENNVNEHDAKLLEFSGLDTRVTDIENNVNELKGDLAVLYSNIIPLLSNAVYTSDKMNTYLENMKNRIPDISVAPLYSFINGTHIFSDGSILTISNGNHVKYECESTHKGNDGANPLFALNNINGIAHEHNGVNNAASMWGNPPLFNIPANSSIIYTLKNFSKTSDGTHLLEFNIGKEGNSVIDKLFSTSVTLNNENSFSVQKNVAENFKVQCFYVFFNTCESHVTYEFDLEFTINGKRYI